MNTTQLTGQQLARMNPSELRAATHGATAGQLRDAIMMMHSAIDPGEQNIVRQYQSMGPGPERLAFRRRHLKTLEAKLGKGKLSA